MIKVKSFIDKRGQKRKGYKRFEFNCSPHNAYTKDIKEMNLEDNKPICIIEVNENLRRIKLNQELEVKNVSVRIMGSNGEN